MNEKSLKELLFKKCLVMEAAARKLKNGSADSIGKVALTGGANALRIVIKEAGLEEEYRYYYYKLALKVAGDNPDDFDKNSRKD